MTQLKIDQIRRDGGTQMRLETDQDTVETYAEALKAGAFFPAIVVFKDSEGAYWLADGFHRVLAYLLAERKTIEADLRQGELRDALLFAFGTNQNHGLRRSNADKHHCVMQMLEDEEWSQWANRRIATACGVSEGLVRVMREDFNAKRKAREAAEAASASAYETQMRNAPVPDVVVKVKRGSQVYDMKHAPKPDKLKRVRYETCQVCSGTGRVKVEE